MADAPFGVQQAHRWFAVELNNLAWDIVEAESRSEEELERMIHAAHAACFHWLQVGNPLNHLRAESLLASAYFTAGLPEAAVRHAEKCLRLGEAAGNTQSQFDRACTQGCAAAAYVLAGDLSRAKQHFAELQTEYATLEDADQGVIDQLYRRPLADQLA